MITNLTICVLVSFSTLRLACSFFLCSPFILGNNILYVGVYGPKGPCEEVFIKHLGRNNYQVNYLVKERGDYIVIVKWGDEHIPGSPFKVDVWVFAVVLTILNLFVFSQFVILIYREFLRKDVFLEPFLNRLQEFGCFQ